MAPCPNYFIYVCIFISCVCSCLCSNVNSCINTTLAFITLNFGIRCCGLRCYCNSEYHVRRNYWWNWIDTVRVHMKQCMDNSNEADYYILGLHRQFYHQLYSKCEELYVLVGILQPQWSCWLYLHLSSSFPSYHSSVAHRFLHSLLNPPSCWQRLY